jgi:hypothetical protein
MPCLGRTRLVFDLLAVTVWLSLRRHPSSPRSFHVSRWPPRRAFSIMANPRSDYFEYTSGRLIYVSHMIFYGVYV